MSEDHLPEKYQQEEEEEPGFRYMLSDRDKAWEKINDTRIEFSKLQHDWMKHLSTLCTGSILVISALSGSIFKDSYLLRWLIPVSLVLLLLALVLLVFSMWHYLRWSERTGVFWYLQADEGHEVYEDLNKVEEVATRSDFIATTLVAAGSICFVLGVVSFCAFALSNAGAF